MPRALITGITGQDGSYLAELLLSKGYEVHGIVHPDELKNPLKALWRIRGIQSDLRLHAGALDESAGLAGIVSRVKPDECYHLAAKSFVSYSPEDELATLDTNIKGTHSLLAAVTAVGPGCRFFFAGSGEVFGKARQVPQTEETPFRPRSVYGISKVAGVDLTRYYREGRGMFAVNGILFNHESPRRGLEFVTRKITYNAARISLGLEKELHLGNLEARRDWGHAADYVQAMWMMLRRGEPDDFVIATGETHTVREFCETAFRLLGMDYRDHVVIDERLFRPSEGEVMCGDSTKARRLLGWKPQRTFAELVGEMVEADIQALKERRSS